ncbi:hypothetical protein TrCOL_g5288 [Triparma columacea]|uniref:Uncharacterized protein n=1 Tax=Triparma columacea TaxID=722753 RepID=A0A9W7LEX9_9STRA|nr:hypothetical protein TrCOL_g5288 [Triparma columacea]
MPRESQRTHVPSTRLEGFDLADHRRGSSDRAKGRKTIRNKAKKRAYDKIRYQTDAYKAKAKERRETDRYKAVSKAWSKKRAANPEVSAKFRAKDKARKETAESKAKAKERSKKPGNIAKAKERSKKPGNIAKAKERREKRAAKARKELTERLEVGVQRNVECGVEKGTAKARQHLNSGYAVIVFSSSLLTRANEIRLNTNKLEANWDEIYGRGAWAREMMKNEVESVFFHVFELDGHNGEYQSGTGGIASLEPCGFVLGRNAEKDIVAAIGKDVLVNAYAGGAGKIPIDTRYGAVEILVVKLR